jgi:nucleotide-binding universal stress UspA family protein
MKRPSIRNILVPIDFSKLSIDAIKTAKRLAQRFGASIHLAHVRQFDYAANFSAPAPPFAPFSLMMYEQDGEKRVSKSSTRWHVNTAYHQASAMFLVPHPRSMKSVGLQRKFRPISS